MGLLRSYLHYISLSALLLVAILQHHGASGGFTKPYTVGKSSRGLLIDGKPRLLTTASIHYPRSTPGMWDKLMKKAKAGGINTIDTYVFWSIHEPEKRQYDFATDRANLPLFLETAKRNGLYVVLRIGPYVCAEWSNGGFPLWLRYEPDIKYRTYSEPFLREVKGFLRKVIEETRAWLPEHGGPLVAMQIENEYGYWQRKLGEPGDRYAQWCGETAHSFNLSVPWIMCSQDQHVDHVIPTHNGLYDGNFMAGFQNSYPDFPGMWTEMWPAWFQRWGEPAPHRRPEDIAYAIASWFAHGGSYVAYYMYHGGTNFGRAGSAFITTSYDYDGFLDEYGLENWPKYAHLADLHKHIIANEDVITSNSVPDPIRLNGTSAYVYGDERSHLAFIVNDSKNSNAIVKFDGLEINVPKWSVTLVKKDGKAHVLFNTAVLSDSISEIANKPARFESIDRPALDIDNIKTRAVLLPDSGRMPYTDSVPLEQITLTNDTTDYMWYQTNVAIDGECADRRLVMESAGDLVHVYIDGEYLGMKYGGAGSLSTFAVDIPEHLGWGSEGRRQVVVSVLSQVMGIENTQDEMPIEHYSRGLLGKVSLCARDITIGSWRMSPGIDSTPSDLPTALGDRTSHRRWSDYPGGDASHGQRTSKVKWYAIEVDARALEGMSGPFAIDLGSMSKGQVWINDKHLGRYWLLRSSKHLRSCTRCEYAASYSPYAMCRSGCGEPSQRYYHLPRDYIDFESGAKNVIYILEEVSGDPTQISLVERIVDRPAGYEDNEDNSVQYEYSVLWIVVAALAASALVVVIYKAERRHKARLGYVPIQ